MVQAPARPRRITLKQSEHPAVRAWMEKKARANKAKMRQLLSNLLNQIVLLEGKKGRGKSLAGTAITHNLRELFGKPVVIVGTKVGLNEERFGPFKFLNEREFIDQLDQISAIADTDEEGKAETNVERALKTMGIDIMNSTIVFDEAIKLFDARTPSDKLVRLFGYFVAQARHYNITIVIMIPNRDNLDKRVRRQIDWFGRCTTTCRSIPDENTGAPKCIRKGCPHRTTVRFVGGLERFKIRINGPDYWPMYNTWSIAGFRPSQLNVKNI